MSAWMVARQWLQPHKWTKEDRIIVTFMGSLSGFKCYLNNVVQHKTITATDSRIWKAAAFSSIDMQIFWIVNDNFEISEPKINIGQCHCVLQPADGMIWRFRVNLLGEIPMEAAVQMTNDNHIVGSVEVNTVGEKSVITALIWLLSTEHDLSGMKGTHIFRCVRCHSFESTSTRVWIQRY